MWTVEVELCLPATKESDRIERPSCKHLNWSGVRFPNTYQHSSTIPKVPTNIHKQLCKLVVRSIGSCGLPLLLDTESMLTCSTFYIFHSSSIANIYIFQLIFLQSEQFLINYYSIICTWHNSRQVLGSTWFSWLRCDLVRCRKRSQLAS